MSFEDISMRAVPEGHALHEDTTLDELHTSDEDRVEAEHLLHVAKDHSPFMSALDAGDIASLADIISVVRFFCNEEASLID